MDWRILAVSVPIFFVSFQSLSRLLPKDAPIFLINAYASAIGVLLMLTLHLSTHPQKNVQLTGKSLLLALGIGTLISLGNFGVIKTLSLGAPQSQFTPLFYITLIIYGLLAGFLIWNERLSPVQILGIGLACFGIFIAFTYKK